MIQKTPDGFLRDRVVIHKGTLLAKVVGTLMESDVPLSAREISIETGVERKRVGTALHQLRFKGWVVRLPKSRDKDGHIGYKWELRE